MNDHELEALAAEYVLGTLDGDERDRLAEAADRDPGVRAAIEEWETRLADLESDTSTITAPDQLWRRIDDAIEASAPEALSARTIRAEQGQWVPRTPGVEKKTLYVDHEAGVQCYLLRVAAGATIPLHDHAAVEECLMVEGDITVGNLHYYYPSKQDLLTDLLDQVGQPSGIDRRRLGVVLATDRGGQPRLDRRVERDRVQGALLVRVHLA